MKTEKKQSLKRQSKKPIKKSKNNIPKETTSYGFRKKVYRVLRDAFLSFNPICEICKIRKATSLHHRAGRRRNNLFRYFLATCRECHNWIHDNPSEAKKFKYLISENSNDETKDIPIVTEINFRNE